jgi:hypothetical protein
MPDSTCHLLTVIDGETEELLDLIEIRAFDLIRFREQFDVPVESDPDLLDKYAVGPGDVEFLREVLGLELQFDFSRYGYFVEAATKHG